MSPELVWKSRDLGQLSGFQSKQNGDSPLGEHRHGFNVCCCGTKDAPSNRIRRFHSIPYGNVVLPGPCAVSDHDDPTAAGQLRALATAANKRASALPDVPTMAEAGMADFDTSLWFGLLAPAGTPRAVVERLAAAAHEAVRAPDAVETLRKQGYEPLEGGRTSSRPSFTAKSPDGRRSRAPRASKADRPWGGHPTDWRQAMARS